MGQEVAKSRFFKKTDLVVVVDTLNIKPDSVEKLVDRIVATAEQTTPSSQVLIAMHRRLDPYCTPMADMVKEKFPRDSVNVVGFDGPYNFAYVYLKGLEAAANLGSRVVEIDSGGGHIPEQLDLFTKGLDNFDVVLSSRFLPGGENTYPISRKVTSWTVTQLSNFFLETALTDASSGFQGFRADVLKRLFQAVPPENWICKNNQEPFHMYQTEMRALVSWMNGLKITEVPITYGAEKEGKGLPLSYQLKALLCFWKIWKKKVEVQGYLSSAGS